MPLSRLVRYPIWALQLFGPTKSFARNPILGNPRLNELGLHSYRLGVAHRMARWRRRSLARHLSAQDAADFDRDGFILKRDYLPPDLWRALQDEVAAMSLPAREMREGQTVTRMTPVTASTRAALPVAARVAADRGLNAMTRYVASYGGVPVWFFQTVIAEPDQGAADPQTELHSDTFFPTAKAWLFLQDVGEDDGPFAYVPGSHRLSEARRAWEHRCSITAAQDARQNHRGGSLRVRAAELDEMGLPGARRMAVPANTLIIADTHGFHGRTPSQKRTVRVELHGHHRSNPFQLWSAFDLKSWPWIRERQLDLSLAIEDFQVARFGRRRHWHPVPAGPLDAPAHI
ncbi:MAG: phytanoyl-CoA dioxygenase family protein [Pseudomonadota bacterium]